ncbi:MAG: sensor histidine kinase [Lachnospiraceae bacterium]|nr:sensor histidine kinase [Lachnospiraceae bacterium]
MDEVVEAVMKRTKEEYTRKKSLRWSMIRRLLFGWFFPLFMLILMMMLLIRGNLYRQVEQTIMASLDKTVDIMRIQLKDCETASKNASYIDTIAKSYAVYQKDRHETLFKKEVEKFLLQQYGYNDNCKTAELVLLEEPESCYYVLNYSNEGSYQDIKFFQETAQDAILEAARELDTATALVGVGGRIYMVRNLVNSKFVPYAVLALELDKEYLMKSYHGIWGYLDASLYRNGELMAEGTAGKCAEKLPERIVGLLEEQETVYEYCKGAYSYVYRRMEVYGETMILMVCLDNAVIHAETMSMKYFFLLLLIFMIPLVIQMMRFFHKKVTIPLRELITAADAVREGNLGIQIENREDNEEFYHVKDSFNHMSRQLKNQFDRIYLEEIALRDAKIMALQSQINPHFLNNTLEIINWEARMNGNYKVSGMIEALSTMLGATMNRKAQQFHSVAEEMAYADAYLYIISQRFGAKFQCEKRIDERLLTLQVPRLIIQPIVENAVEHGMDISKKGCLEIRLYQREDKYLCIEVEDNGRLTSEKKEKIDRLLSKDASLSGEKRVSLGIRNVDQRLKMIYGENCGLFIRGNERENTVSTILLKTEISYEQ